MTQVQLIARHTIKPGHESEVFALLTGFVDATRAEPGSFALLIAYSQRPRIRLVRRTGTRQYPLPRE